jgi:hypothetical protein
MKTETLLRDNQDVRPRRKKLAAANPTKKERAARKRRIGEKKAKSQSSN